MCIRWQHSGSMINIIRIKQGIDNKPPREKQRHYRFQELQIRSRRDRQGDIIIIIMVYY